MGNNKPATRHAASLGGPLGAAAPLAISSGEGQGALPTDGNQMIVVCLSA